MLLCPINNGKSQGGGISIIRNKCRKFRFILFLGCVKIKWRFPKRRIKIIVDVNGRTDFNVMKMNEK